MKMTEELENKLDAILKEMKPNKSASTVTNPRSEKMTPRICNRRGPKLTSL